jgi:hypothetical protein
MHWDIGPTPLSLEGGGQTGGYGCSFVNFFSSEKPLVNIPYGYLLAAANI